VADLFLLHLILSLHVAVVDRKRTKLQCFFHRADLQSDLGEMLDWVRDVMADDPDSQSRDLAMACMVLLQEASDNMAKA
jgi:hypothetical protein